MFKILHADPSNNDPHPRHNTRQNNQRRIIPGDRESTFVFPLVCFWEGRKGALFTIQYISIPVFFPSDRTCTSKRLGRNSPPVHPTPTPKPPIHSPSPLQTQSTLPPPPPTPNTPYPPHSQSLLASSSASP